MSVLPLALFILLLLLRRLLWGLRWLWCWRGDRKTPPPIPLLPRRSSRLFEERLQQSGCGETP